MFFRPVVESVMHMYAPEGFSKRTPGAHKMKRTALVSVGPDEEWSVDGHDKLLQAGFAIYGIRDKWTGRYLLYNVLPSNRHASVIGHQYLLAVKQQGGTYLG